MTRGALGEPSPGLQGTNPDWNPFRTNELSLSALYLQVFDKRDGGTVTACGNAFVPLRLAFPCSLGGALRSDPCQLVLVARRICGSLVTTRRVSSAKRRLRKRYNAASPGPRKQFGNAIHLPFTVYLRVGSAVEPSLRC